MTTERRAITCYLPKDVEQSLTQYCTEYDITRRDKRGKIKPSLGTGIVEVLKVFFSGETLPSPLPSGIGTLPVGVVTEEKLQESLAPLWEAVESLQEALSSGGLAVRQRKESSDSQEEGLSNAGLARVLGVSTSAISCWERGNRQISNPKLAAEFANWQRGEDGSWYRHSEGG